jgi:hypothetical protein
MDEKKTKYVGQQHFCVDSHTKIIGCAIKIPKLAKIPNTVINKNKFLLKENRFINTNTKIDKKGLHKLVRNMYFWTL